MLVLKSLYPQILSVAGLERKNWFAYCYLNLWNSGINSRNMEGFFRDIRAASGKDSVNRTGHTRIADQKEAARLCLAAAKARGEHVVFASDDLIWSMKSDEYTVNYCTEIRLDNKKVQVCVEGDEADVDRVISETLELFKGNPVVHIQSLILDDQGLAINSSYFYPSTANLAVKENYSWLESFGGREDYDIDDFVKEYLASNANVLIFYGERGTGKTTFIRTLMAKIGREKNFITTDEQTMVSGPFRGWLESIGSDAVIAMEDANNLTRTRESGNVGMISLLNASDGVVPTNSKIIISTNLSHLSEVDDALIRSGRTFAAVKFDKLPALQANAARAKAGLPEVEIAENTLTLADAMNYENLHRVHKKQRTGFC